jgi:heme o synthase
MISSRFESFSSYIALTKPKVTLLNLLVGATCFILAAYPRISLTGLAIFCLAGYLACGGCGVLNCAYEKDIDILMQRTAKRPIPSGKISAHQAIVFGIALIMAGIAIGYFYFNLLTAIMISLGAIFYLVIYTIILKRSSTLNVVIGGFAGCFAALSGWTAAANSVSLLPLLISAVDFLWTPGHLWGLAMKKVEEYRKAGVPMLPVKIGLKRAAQAVILLNGATVGVSLALPMLGLAGLLYGVIALSVGLWFIFESRRLWLLPNGAVGFRVFLLSMPYLALLMAGLVVDKLVSA